MEVEIEVPAHSKVAVSIKASRKKVKLKYKGTLCILYIDGVKKCEPTEGYKHEISTESAVVEYGRFQPLMTEGNMNVEPKPISQTQGSTTYEGVYFKPFFKTIFKQKCRII